MYAFPLKIQKYSMLYLTDPISLSIQLKHFVPYQLVIVCIECKLNANEKSIAREIKIKNIGKRRVSPSTTASLISCASATATAVFKPQLLKL